MDADPRVEHFIPDTWQVCVHLITDEFVYCAIDDGELRNESGGYHASTTSFEVCLSNAFRIFAAFYSCC